MNVISTRNLTRRFGKLEAVDNLNLDIPVKALFGLIGPNGAGKTTTLRMLAGLLEPTSGDIRINGLSTRKYWSEIQWQIGYMPDFYGLYDDLLVWEYLDFFCRCYKINPERRRRITNELLELVDLHNKRDAFVSTLSRGMRQRLCLAHALVHDPQILLLDEPASGLDPRARIEMRELLRELNAMGKTILLSSHILSELAELCDSIAIMEKGNLVINSSMNELNDRLIDQHTLRIRVISDFESAKVLLKNHKNVLGIYLLETNPNSSLFDVDYTGDENAVADLLQLLVRENVRISSFSDLNTKLEEAFLRLTKDEVA